MRSVLVLLLPLLVACASPPLGPAAAPSPARVTAALQSELTMEIQELI